MGGNNSMKKYLRFFFIGRSLETVVASAKSVGIGLLLATFIFCFSNNLKAIEKTQIVKSKTQQKMVRDKFVENFVKQLKSDQVTYDGKNLTIYANPKDAYIFDNFLVISVITGLGAFGIARCLERRTNVLPPTVIAFIVVIFDLLFFIKLCRNIYFDLFKSPIIEMDDLEINICFGNKKLPWKDVSKVILKNKGIFYQLLRFILCLSNETSHIALCDQYLNSKIELNDFGDLLPISNENLAALLKHYIKKSKVA